jgi:hypothetical protein
MWRQSRLVSVSIAGRLFALNMRAKLRNWALPYCATNVLNCRWKIVIKWRM